MIILNILNELKDFKTIILKYWSSFFPLTMQIHLRKTRPGTPLDGLLHSSNLKRGIWNKQKKNHTYRHRIPLHQGITVEPYQWLVQGNKHCMLVLHEDQYLLVDPHDNQSIMRKYNPENIKQKLYTRGIWH